MYSPLQRLSSSFTLQTLDTIYLSVAVADFFRASQGFVSQTIYSGKLGQRVSLGPSSSRVLPCRLYICNSNLMPVFLNRSLFVYVLDLLRNLPARGFPVLVTPEHWQSRDSYGFVHFNCNIKSFGLYSSIKFIQNHINIW